MSGKLFALLIPGTQNPSFILWQVSVGVKDELQMHMNFVLIYACGICIAVCISCQQLEKYFEIMPVSDFRHKFSESESNYGMDVKRRNNAYIIRDAVLDLISSWILLQMYFNIVLISFNRSLFYSLWYVNIGIFKQETNVSTNY